MFIMVSVLISYEADKYSAAGWRWRPWTHTLVCCVISDCSSLDQSSSLFRTVGHEQNWAEPGQNFSTSQCSNSFYIYFGLTLVLSRCKNPSGRPISLLCISPDTQVFVGMTSLSLQALFPFQRLTRRLVQRRKSEEYCKRNSCWWDAT